MEVQQAGVYLVELTVDDGDGGTASDRVEIAIGVGSAPIVDIGADRATTMVDPPLVVDGSGSSDPDDDIVAYAWTIQARSPHARARGEGLAQPELRFIPESEGEFQVTLEVSDLFRSRSASIVVSVDLCPGTDLVIESPPGVG